MNKDRAVGAARSFLMLAAMCLMAWPSLGRAASLAPMREIQPAELVKLLAAKGKPPVIFQIGFRVLYVQAHIPGSRYVGPASASGALEQLRHEVQSLPKDTPIILYCGCCPWDRCPNVRPAYEALQTLHFTQVRALFIAKNFGTDWVDHGYPVERGTR